MSTDGLSIASTPFAREVAAVVDAGKSSPCSHYDLELHIAGKNYKPLSIVSVHTRKNYLKDYYPVIAIDFSTTAYDREIFIENMANIKATLKTYDHPRNAPFGLANLKNPKVRQYKAKLYLAESDFVTQNNHAINNAEFTLKKQIVNVMIQLVEPGFEDLKTRYIGGTYYNQTGAGLLRHLIDYHANLNNDDVNTLINGVDIAPNFNTEVRSQIVIEDGTNLVAAMDEIHHNSGGIYGAGFSYFIQDNIWYIYPPYALNRFNDNTQKLIIVNLPADKMPGMEKTYNDKTNTIIILSTRDATSKDNREAKRIETGNGVRFADAAKMMSGFASAVANKLNVMASNNVNDLMVQARDDGVNYLKFGKTKITSAKNVELSKLAPSRGFMMRLSWENSKDSLIKPGMPVKVLYLKRNQTASAVGTVIGCETVNYAVENSYPAMKFASLTYIDVFVSDEDITQTT